MSRVRHPLDQAIGAVVRSQNCSGCGACVRLDTGLAMSLDENGFQRPVRVAPGRAVTSAAQTFDAVCPGRRVNAVHPPEAERHPTMGPVVSAWQAWATDPAVRHRGSSGGALTALVGWLVSTGEIASFTGVRAEPQQPDRTVSVSITSKAEALAASGSRYAPVATIARADLNPGHGVVAKPCEVSAARLLLQGSRDRLDRSGRPAPVEEARPLLLSFFCAGTPSQHATHRLLRELGLPADANLQDLWYRGRGWPGRFTASAAHGATVSASYDNSWGDHLGKALQWRCKICPDGVGESADISAADYWQTDPGGFPSFTEEPGRSALLARTRRGHDTVIRAFAAGVLVGEPLDVDRLAAVQPFQVSRRMSLQARLLGTRSAGRPVPRYRGFGLTRLGSSRWREGLRVARASYRRVRAESARKRP